jgi:alditol oxidase
MNKREFLKTSGVLLTGSMLSHLAKGEQALEPHRTNWAGNIEYSTGQLYKPATVEEVQQIVKSSARLRALGARHSFNRIADSKAAQISLEHLNTMQIDAKAHTVTVGSGVKYGQLAPYIDQHGFAVPNLASLPHVTVVGATATATHGSGIKNGNLSTSVSGLEIVTADGNKVTLSRAKDGEQFQGMVVNLGAMGIVTSITLDLVPTFQVAQMVYQNLSFSHLDHHFDEIFGSGYSVSLFTDWQNHQATQVWIKKRVENGTKPDFPAEFYGAKRATEKLHPVAGHSAESCTEQMGIPGPWYERLPHFKMNFTPSSGQELQTEYFVPREKGYEAILAVEKLKDRTTPHLFITELRTIDEDHLWISPCYRRPSLALHFTWKPEWPEVRKILPLIEKELAPFDTRPHWAKLFTMPPAQLQGHYTKMADFKKLLQHYDPHGKFRNEFLETHLYGS